MTNLINTFGNLPLYFIGLLIPAAIIAAIIISNRKAAKAN